jgi:hypothetical protein
LGFFLKVRPRLKKNDVARFHSSLTACGKQERVTVKEFVLKKCHRTALPVGGALQCSRLPPAMQKTYSQNL